MNNMFDKLSRKNPNLQKAMKFFSSLVNIAYLMSFSKKYKNNLPNRKLYDKKTKKLKYKIICKKELGIFYSKDTKSGVLYSFYQFTFLNKRLK